MSALRTAVVGGWAVVLLAATCPASPPAVRIVVSKNIELFGVLAALADGPASPGGSTAPVVRFEDWRDHRAAAFAGRILRQRGRNSLARLALRLSDLPEARPLDPSVPAAFRTLLRQAVPAIRDFARVSDFETYWAERRPALESWASAAERALAGIPLVPALEGLFGASSAEYRMVYAPLMERLRTGDLRNGPGGEEATVVFGPREGLEDGGRPVGRRLAIDVALLEFSRLRVYGLVDRHARSFKRLAGLASRAGAAAGPTGPRKPWRAFSIDNLTAAVQAHLAAGLFGEDEGADLLARVHGDDVLAPALRAGLADFERDRGRYPTLDAFLPVLLSRLERDRAGRKPEAGP